MTLERAKQIVADCMAHVWFREALTAAPPPSLAQYTLPELLDANHLVAGHAGEREEGATTIMMHCDDRLVAALYVLYHYPPLDPDAGPVSVYAANSTAGVLVVKLPVVASRGGEE